MANYPAGFSPSHSARFSLDPVTRCSGPASLDRSAEGGRDRVGGEVGGGLKERARENERDDTGNDKHLRGEEEEKPCLYT